MDDVGLIAASVALQQGYTRSAIRALVRRGAWRPVLWGIYATPVAVLPMPALRRRAALMRAGPDGWLCGLSALAEWGFHVGDGHVVHLAMTRTGAMRGERGRLVVHRRAPGRARWVERGGLRLEPFDAAVLTAFATLASESLRRELLCQAVGQRRTTVARLRAAAGARGPFRHAPELRTTLALVELGCRSPIEIDYLLLVERPYGLPRGDRQAPLVRRRGGRVGAAYGDVFYRELRVLVELDGSDDHCDANRRADLRRDLDLAALGILTIRLTGYQVRHEAAATAAALREVFAERRRLLGLPAA